MPPDGGGVDGVARNVAAAGDASWSCRRGAWFLNGVEGGEAAVVAITSLSRRRVDAKVFSAKPDVAATVDTNETAGCIEL